MRILWIRVGRLVPVTSGGQIRSAFTIRELRKRHDVTIFSVYEGRTRDLAYEGLLQAHYPGSHAVPLGPRPWHRNPVVRVRRQLTLRPIGVGFSWSAEAAAGIRELTRPGAFDVVVSDLLQTSVNLPDPLEIPSVLFEHNVESDLSRSQAACAESLRSRLAFHVDALRLARYESRQLRRFDRTVAVSEEDAARLRKLAPGSPVTGLDTGVDLDEYRPAPLPDPANPLVVFTGLMSYVPNVDAVRWFCARIWPLVLAEVPRARFRIVGRNPHPSVQALASETVEVTGEVESVVPHLQEASVVVIPLRAGSGTRLKVFEAMASGRPIVSTTLGPAGLEVRDGEDIVLADEPEAFGREVVRLLRDRAHAESIARAAAATGARHGWETVVPAFERVLEDLVVATQRDRQRASGGR